MSKQKDFSDKYGGAYATPYFSPNKNSNQISIGFMRRCSHFLDIAVYSITHEEIGQAIIEAHQRLKRVRVVMDKAQAMGRYSRYNDLRAAGVPCIHDTQSGLMHLKIALDYGRKKGRLDSRAVLLGSYNWTKSATERNRENQLILRIKKVVMGHILTFEEIWEANGGYEQFPKTRLLTRKK